MLYLGVDAGSVYIGLVGLDDAGTVRFQAYQRHHGEPAKVLQDMLARLDRNTPVRMARTGSGATALPLSGPVYDAVISGIEGVRHLVPDVHNIISVGGGSFSLTELNGDGSFRRSTLNSACASGTGAFIDQQSLRLQIPPAELPERAMRFLGTPPPVATRCAVFAKSDMIHLQQEGHSIDAIACGLCHGMGHSTVDGLLGGRKVEGKVVLIGGVALNSIVVKSIIDRLGTDVIVPESPHLASALGAALLARGNGTRETPIAALIDAIDVTAKDGDTSTTRSLSRHHEVMRPPLKLTLSSYPEFLWADHWIDGDNNEATIVSPRTGQITVALGLDIGSTSTKATLLDENDAVVGWVYRKTAGDPIRAVQLVFRALRDMQQRGGFHLDIQGVGTTGSGRKMIHSVIGADLVMNEITAHATAALFLDPHVDTIIELGGQDAKFTQLQNGMVYNSVMNYVCAAGTGSFIEEQAQKLDISLDDFAERAMDKQAPTTSDRCTVYMERDLDLLLARGWSIDQVAAAVLHSVRDNYLNKVVGGLQIGNHIYFQGATARNRALVAAFEVGLQKPIRVSAYCHLTGALGMSLLVRKRIPPEQRSRCFKGLEFADATVRIQPEICDICRNRCQLQLIHTGDSTVAWGLKCGRDYAARTPRPSSNPDFAFWKQRDKAWRNGKAEAVDPAISTKKTTARRRVGLPRSLAAYNYYPYWNTLLRELDCEPVMPRASTETVLRRGTEIATAEFCAPVLMSIGHARDLLESDKVDYLLVPHMMAETTPPGFTNAFFCCYVQAHASVLKSFKGLVSRDRILAPIVSFQHDRRRRENHLIDALAKPLEVTPQRIRHAMQRAQAAQEEFVVTSRELGTQALADMEQNDALGIVCIGRPYNTTDAGMVLDIPHKIAAMGYPVLFMDMLKPDLTSILPSYSNMYWHYGQQILATAEQIARSKRLFAIFFTNFMCGPDSYLLTYFKDIMGRYQKPYLCLQFDGHGADAGYLTRVEAALETFHAWSQIPFPRQAAETASRAFARDDA